MDKKSADIIYYNAIIGQNTYNNVYKPSKNREIATYTDNRSIPILTNPSEYYGSVVRMSLACDSLPLRIIPISDDAPTNINKTIYTITMDYTTYTSNTVYLSWESEGNYTIPSSIPNNNFNSDPYYYLYTINHFISLVNNTFISAYNLLNTNSGFTLPTSTIPYLIYDPKTKLCKLIVDDSYDENSANPIKIYFNSYLYNIFYSFESYQQNDSTGTNKKNYLLRIRNNGDNIYDQTGANPKLYYFYKSIPPTPINKIIYIIEQEVNSLWYLNQLLNIIITSKSIGVYSEYTPSTITFGSTGILAQDNGSNSNTDNVITDFEPLSVIDQTNTIRTRIEYNPTAQYRYFVINNSQPLYNIDFQLYWIDFFGFKRPIYLSAYNCASLKIQFIKKSLVNKDK